MKTDDALSATVEEYLETIYNMSMEDEVVIGARLAEKFCVSPPTVTEMLKRLVRDGYVEMDNKRQVTLTEAGNQAAEAVLRRHRLTERFLVDMLGMQWHQVHEEALILYLHEKGLTPGTQLSVLSSGGQNEEEHEEDFTLQVAAHNVSISKTVAAKIWVTR